MPVPEAERAQEATEAPQFPGAPLTSAGALEVAAEDRIEEVRRMIPISSIAARKSSKSSATSAPVAPWHKAENGPDSKNVSKSDSGRGGSGGDDDLEMAAGRGCLLDFLRAGI